MRLAVLVALDGSHPGGLATPGDVDPWLKGALARLGFRVVASMDDLAAGATLLVHVTGPISDAVAPLRALSDRVAASRPESTLFLAELTHDGPPDESLVAAEHVEVVREALAAKERGYSAVVAVRPVSAALEAYAFTQLVVRASRDDSRNEKGAGAPRLSEVVERLRQMPERHMVAQGYAHVRGSTDFALGWAGAPAPLLHTVSPDEAPAFAPLLGLADGARDQRHWDHAIAGYRAALLVAGDVRARAAVLMRLGGVERAQGDLHAATRSFEKARATSPADADPGALEALVALTSELGEWKSYIAYAREMVNVQATPHDKVDLLFGLARTLGQELRDLPGAVRELERARQIEPKREEVLEALRRAYRVLGEWKKLIEITGVLADEGPTEAERSARRFAQAKIALDKLGDAQLGIAFLDAALTEDPTNDEALDILVETRTARGEVRQLGRALEELAERYDEMGDVERAKDARRCLLALPPEREEVSVVAERTGPMLVAPAAEMATELPPEQVTETELPPDSLVEDMEELPPASQTVRASHDHADMRSATPSEIEGLSELDLAFGMTLPIKRSAPPTTPVQAPSHALQAPQAHVHSQPVEALPEPVIDVPIFMAGETGLHAALVTPQAFAFPPSATVPEGTNGPESTEMDDGAALLELEEWIARSPLDAAAHARLFALHTRAGRVDRAYLAALALEELGATEPEHEAALDQCRPEAPLRLRALLDGPAWEAMRAPGGDDVVEALFGAVSKAALAAHIEDRRGRKKLLTLDPDRKQSQTSTVSIVASFHWAARVLGVDCPELYVHDEVPGDIAAVPTAEPSTVLGPRVLSGLATKELAFLAARHLTYYRREHIPLVHFSTLPELTLLVLACVQIELPGVPIPQSVAASVASLRGRISRHLTPADRSTMAAAVQSLESRGGRLDLATWVRSVELTATRAGLFLCGDLRSAMARLRADEGLAGTAVFDQMRADLLAFTASRAHADLRAEFALVAAPRSSGVRSREDVAAGADRSAMRTDPPAAGISATG